jgi:L-ascorbate metabolism protein UlaG (beta-lactamase superfamily)
MAHLKFMQRIVFLAIAATLLVNCSPGQTQPAAAPTTTAPPIVIVVTNPPTPTPNLIGNNTGKTIISRANQDMGYRTTYMIISKSGTVIVADPFRILDGIKADVITSSHKDYDHNDAKFYAANDCKKSLYTVEKFSVKDVTVTGIASSHSGDDIDYANPSNVIYVFDVDGLRIAHMGDIAQSSLTPEQLQTLGRVDIVITIMEDQPYYGFSKEKSLAILKQLNPRVALPTHPDRVTLEAVGKSVDETLNETFRWAVSKDDLQDGKRRLVLLNLYPETP